jgi:hypothetical protein
MPVNREGIPKIKKNKKKIWKEEHKNKNDNENKKNIKKVEKKYL